MKIQICRHLAFALLLIANLAWAEQPPQKLLKKMEALSYIVEWIQDPARGNGRQPSPSDFTAATFPFSYARLTGLYQYEPGERQAHNAIFSSVEEFWLTLHEYGATQGVPISLIQAFVRNPSDDFKRELQAEALALVFDWVQRSGKLPQSADFGIKAEQIPVQFDQLTGVGLFSSGREREARALYDSPETFWRTFKSYAAARNVNVRLLEVHFSGPLSSELTGELQEEVHDLVSQWILDHNGSLPERCHFGSASGQIPVSHQRLFGGDKGRREAVGLFAGPQDFWRRQKVYMQARGNPIYLLRAFFKSGLEVETRKIVQQEALELVLQWIDKHQQSPKLRHFGMAPGQIPIRYHRLTASSLYHEGQPNYGSEIFASTAQFWQRLAEYASVKGVTLPDPNVRAPRTKKNTPAKPRAPRTSAPKKSQFNQYPTRPKSESKTTYFSQSSVALAKSVAKEPKKRILKRTPQPVEVVPVSEERRQAQKEAIDIIADWIETSELSDGRVPRWLEFEDFGGTIPLSYRQLTGATDAAPQEPLRADRIFDSFKDYKVALEERLGPLDRKKDCYDLF